MENSDDTLGVPRGLNMETAFTWTGIYNIA